MDVASLLGKGYYALYTSHSYRSTGMLLESCGAGTEGLGAQRGSAQRSPARINSAPGRMALEWAAQSIHYVELRVKS